MVCKASDLYVEFCKFPSSRRGGQKAKTYKELVNWSFNMQEEVQHMFSLSKAFFQPVEGREGPVQIQFGMR